MYFFKLGLLERVSRRKTESPGLSGVGSEQSLVCVDGWLPASSPHESSNPIPSELTNYYKTKGSE